MAFSSYKTIGDVLKKFQITYREETFGLGVALPISDYFRADIDWVLRGRLKSLAR